MADEAVHKDLELSRVFALTIQAFTRRPLTAFLLGALTVTLPSELYYRLAPAPPEGWLTLGFAAHALASIALIALSAVLCGWVTLTFIGSTSSLFEVVKRSALFVGALFVVNIIMTLGLLLFVVPGVTWALATAVAVPVAAVERLGMFLR
jgi:hypothetical protein